MCRLLGYLGRPTELDRLLLKPEHSLIVQSYLPQEMTSGTVNADGFGIGWYHPNKNTPPYTYKNTLPIWSDINLPGLSRFIESGCVLANVRNATAGQTVDLSNCQPFQHNLILGTHNGAIANFRQTLYRPLRDRLNDIAYQSITGNSDSEHIFALVIHELETCPELPLAEALVRALATLRSLAIEAQTNFSANVILSNGQQLVASRFAHGVRVPSLYWLRNHDLLPQSILVASEPIFCADWHPCQESHVMAVGRDLEIQILPIE
jgi:glutamine amidotransferase